MSERSAFWEGFWFGLNPLNSIRVLRNVWEMLRAKEKSPTQEGEA